MENSLVRIQALKEYVILAPLILFQIMMKHLSTLVLFFIACLPVTRASEADSTQLLFQEAERVMALRHQIKQAKEMHIKGLVDSLKQLQVTREKSQMFDLLMDIQQEYEFFVYDSAFHYSQKAIELAYVLKDPSKIAFAKSKLALNLLLKGLYNDAVDTLKTIDPQVLSPSRRIGFYSYFYRAYYDLSNYSRDKYYSPRYKEQGHVYTEKIFKEANENSYQYLLAKALNHLARGNHDRAMAFYSQLIDEHPLDHHQLAICYFGMGFIYSVTGENEKAKWYLLKSTIEDMLSATKETAASRVLAELLFNEGNIDDAYKFIHLAKEDADFYGTEQRKLEISYVLPRIEGAWLNRVEAQKNVALDVSIGMSVLAIIIIIFSLIIYRQLSKLRKARKTILESNESLKEVNEMLREANKIKVEYIGYYFNFSSQYIDKLDNLKKVISHQLLTKKYDEIAKELKGYNSKKEREQLFNNFDRIFLKLFPDFVARFNDLFNEEDRIVLKDPYALNTNLRIFALIRLGVRDNEKIASVLDFSVNTIYTYKTRIKKKSIVPNEEFEDRIMDIRSV
ncbi:tetratricopeptide repeat protein [Marinilabiliaceae bacterium JC017]|nr:tetratricopeptide repeat protein [Marinilabiliaceae bacterium JC017]